MRKPCADDMNEAAEVLRNTVGPIADACRRVASYLERVNKADAERASAKSLGCTVRYLRKVVNHV